VHHREPFNGTFRCPILIFGNADLTDQIGLGSITSDGAFGLVEGALSSIGGLVNLTYSFNTPAGTPEELRDLFTRERSIQYVFLPPNIADIDPALAPVINRVIDWKGTAESIGVNLTGNVTDDANRLYLKAVGYAPFIQSGINANWELVCDYLGKLLYMLQVEFIHVRCGLIMSTVLHGSLVAPPSPPIVEPPQCACSEPAAVYSVPRACVEGQTEATIRLTNLQSTMQQGDCMVIELVDGPCLA